MVKRIISVVGAAALLATLPSVAFAETSSSDGNISIPLTPPIGQSFEVTPGHPFQLQGCDNLNAQGNGSVYFQDRSGYISLAGKGTLAVEENDLSKVKVVGFTHKIRIWHWVVFVGRGEAKASGRDLDILFRGQAKVYTSGCGEASFYGHWTGTYWHYFLIGEPIPMPTPKPPIPEPIELESVLSVTN